MHDSNDLVKLIKRAAIDAVNASKPCNLVFGTVTSISPLQINVEQKMTLTSAQIVLSRNVTDYKVKIDINDKTENGASEIDLSHTHGYSGTTGSSNSHSHSYSGTTETGGKIDITHSHKFKGIKEIIIKNALAIGDEVIMIRMQGGQKYIVIDKVVKVQ